jgi:hypothetical protein
LTIKLIEGWRLTVRPFGNEKQGNEQEKESHNWVIVG